MAIIGRATAQNAAAIARVYVDTWRATYPGLLPDRVLLGLSYDRQRADWSWLIRNRGQAMPVLVAAEIGHGVVGFASCGAGRPTSRPAAGPFALTPLTFTLSQAGGQGAGSLGGISGDLGEVFTLYVRPEFQERGIGRQLLAASFAALCERGFARAMVWVLSQSPSRFFYERMGAQRMAERREGLWGVDVDEVAYAWSDLALARARLGSCSAS